MASRLEDSELLSDQYSRIIVVSDMHGDAQALIQSLYLGYRGVVGSSAIPLEFFVRSFISALEFPSRPIVPLYAGNDVALVQMGDLVDRGKFSQTCIRIMNVTEAVTGFKTVTLMGNHELFAILRDDLYDQLVHPQDDLNRHPEEFQRPHGYMWHHVTDQMLPLVRWGPPRVANISVSPRDLSSMSTLFVHAGITEEFLYRFNIIEKPREYQTPYHPFEPQLMLRAPLANGSTTISVESFNRMVHEDLSDRSFADLATKYTYEWSPFTSRSYGEPDFDCASIDRILSLFDVARIVIGHLPSMAHRVRTNCNGKILISDIGASRYMLGPDRDEETWYPGAIILNATSDSLLMESVSAYYLDVVGSRIYSEKIWADGMEIIQSLNVWAEHHHGASMQISPAFDGTPREPFSITTPSPSKTPHDENDSPVDRKRPRIDPPSLVLSEKTEDSSGATAAAAPSIYILGPVYQDRFCKIQKGTVDGVEGFILNFLSEDSYHLSEFLRDEILNTQSYMNFPSIHDLPPAQITARTRINPLRSNPFPFRRFLGTDTSMLLHDYEESNLTRTIVDQIDNIIDTLHSANLCLGIQTHSEPVSPAFIMSFFGIDIETESVELINMSRLRRCYAASELRAERRLFALHISDNLSVEE